MERSKKTPFPVALTIAGSDSGGGAGIQADLRTFTAFGVFGCSAICAVTSQNPLTVSRIDLLPPEAVTTQIQAVRSAIRLGAVKTGMLGSAAIIDAVANALQGLEVPLILDPVMVSTSGARLLPPDAVEALKTRLLPIAAWITPNLPEAEVLTGLKITSRAEMIAAARRCCELWQCGCILKGGHLQGGKAANDIICFQENLYELTSPLVQLTGNTAHGTGCTLSSAFAAALANGHDWLTAIRQAKAFILGSLMEPVNIGNGIDAMFPPERSRLEEIGVKKLA